jgi:hypothetical protein
MNVVTSAINTIIAKMRPKNTQVVTIIQHHQLDSPQRVHHTPIEYDCVHVIPVQRLIQHAARGLPAIATRMITPHSAQLAQSFRD